MHIALLHAYYRSDVPSGENESVDAEAAALRASGHQVSVVSRHMDDLSQNAFRKVATQGTIATGIGPSPLDELRRLKPDIVHVHNLHPVFGRHWVARLQTPFVHTLHNYRPLCAQGSFFRDGHPCTDCLRDPSAGLRHSCGGSAVRTLPLWVPTIRPKADPLIHRARRLIVPSERAANQYAQGGVDARKLVVSEHFLPDSQTPSFAAPVGDGPWVAAGRFVQGKGFLRLVRAWPDGEPLVLIGDGPDLSAIRGAARGKNIELRPPTDRAGVLAAMAAGVGVVFPSLFMETFGLIYLEALASGRPVFAFRGNVVADNVERDRTGHVVSWDDDLSREVTSARRDFPAMAGHCRKVFDARFSEVAHQERTMRIYADALSSV